MRKTLSILAALLALVTPGLAAGLNPLHAGTLTSTNVALGSNGNTVVLSSDGTDLFVDGSLVRGGGITLVGGTSDYAHVMFDPASNAFVSSYATRFVTNWAASPLTNFYPQQLVEWNGAVYYARTRIYAIQTNYPGYSSGTNLTYPIPGVHDQWGLFVTNGAQGLQGATGQSGSNYVNVITNANFGAWSALTAYSTGLGAIVWTLDANNKEAWYEPILNSTNQSPPNSTSYWRVVLRSGVDGTITTNGLVYRGAWVNSTLYSTNDEVYYNGSRFAILTNRTVLGASPSSADPPVNNANWDVTVSRGAIGATGSQGPSGNAITTIVQYIQSWSNSVFANNPDLYTNRFFYLSATNGGTNTYSWGPITITNIFTEVSSSTNYQLIVSNDACGQKYYWQYCLTNGSSGGGITYTQANAIVYANAATNPAYLNLGASNTLFVSMGASAAPQFQTLAQLNIATGVPVYVEADTTALAALAANGTDVSNKFLRVTKTGSSNVVDGTIGITNGHLWLQGPSNAQSGGVRFPDGTIQHSAGVSSGSVASNETDSIYRSQLPSSYPLNPMITGTRPATTNDSIAWISAGPNWSNFDTLTATSGVRYSGFVVSATNTQTGYAQSKNFVWPIGATGMTSISAAFYQTDSTASPLVISFVSGTEAAVWTATVSAAATRHTTNFIISGTWLTNAVPGTPVTWLITGAFAATNLANPAYRLIDEESVRVTR